mmetsp:Transcript_146235/g.255376  ORF Transcript_146235/g.255376 Transcript_146235/m.255376 type:complete len:219 (-) Transcript_146235:101-757(-)
MLAPAPSITCELRRKCQDTTGCLHTTCMQRTPSTPHPPPSHGPRMAPLYLTVHAQRLGGCIHMPCPNRTAPGHTPPNHSSPFHHTQRSLFPTKWVKHTRTGWLGMRTPHLLVPTPPHLMEGLVCLQPVPTPPQLGTGPMGCPPAPMRTRRQPPPEPPSASLGASPTPQGLPTGPSNDRAQRRARLSAPPPDPATPAALCPEGAARRRRTDRHPPPQES